MKIVFSMRHSGALRNFASTLRHLEQMGHQVHLVFMMPDKRGDGRLLRELTSQCPGLTAEETGPKPPPRFWTAVARGVRTATDYTRYWTPEYADARALRDRAASRVPALLRAILDRPFLHTTARLKLATRLLMTIERAIPADPRIMSWLSARNPDLVLVTPLVDLGSEQVEYVKAARLLGIRSALAVHSWDNLTNKGLIRPLPDRVFVWNEPQKREAVTMHGVAPDDVVVTGAPVYDQWFARVPATTREEFCGRVGLRADKPFFLYLCSSAFIAADEPAFVAKWVAAVRTAPDPRVREAGILVRPHPDNLLPWNGFDPSVADFVVWPIGGADPVDVASKNDYFDSMYHSVAAVGINTSAQIEAGIIGRPVYSIRAPEYAATQEGTLHFHYLLSEGGGLLRLADTLEQHVQALAAAVRDTEADAARTRSFVRAFVRPHGLDVPATPRMGQAVDALGRMPRRTPESLPLTLYAVRAALYPVALALSADRILKRRSRKRAKQHARPPAQKDGRRALRWRRWLPGTTGGSSR